LNPPVSVYKAGDTIDEVVYELAKARFAKSKKQALAEFVVDIRRYKEELFKNKSIRLPGSAGNLTLEDVESSPPIRKMAHDVKIAVRELLTASRIPWQRDRDKRLDIIFAGGGADIGFLRKAVENGAKEALPLVSRKIVEAVTPPKFEVAAGRPRMAVALGGTFPRAEWPTGRSRQPIPIPGLAPLTKVRSL